MRRGGRFSTASGLRRRTTNGQDSAVRHGLRPERNGSFQALNMAKQARGQSPFRINPVIGLQSLT
jgi:hypothetical protein